MPGPKRSTVTDFRVAPPHLVIPSLLAVVLVVAFGSNTGVSFVGAAILVLWGVFWGLLWLSQMLRIRSMGEQGELKNLASHHVAFRIVFEPLLGVLLATVLWSHLLVKIRLELSSEVVDAFAANVLRDGILTADANQPRQLGLFAVEQVRVSNGAVKLFTCQDGIFGASGLIYSPKAKPENIGEESFSPLAEPWYAWKQTW